MERGAANGALADSIGFFEWCFFFVREGRNDAIAACFGGLIAAFLSLYVALRFFAVAPQAEPERMLSSLFRAEAMKWVWVVLLFGGAARYAPDHFVALVIGFMVSLVVHWLALLWYPNGVPSSR